MLNNKKGKFGRLTGFAVALATIVIILIMTFIVLAQGKNEIASITGAGSVEHNATAEVYTSLALVPSFMPIVVLDGIGAALLGLVALFKNRG